MLYLINLNEMSQDTGEPVWLMPESLHIPIDPTDGDCNDALCGFQYDELTSHYFAPEFDFWELQDEGSAWCETCATAYLQRRCVAHDRLNLMIEDISKRGGDWEFLHNDGFNVVREALCRGFLSLLNERNNSHNS